MTQPISTNAATVWLLRGELAERLRVPKRTLEDWAVDGKGPRFAKFGRHVRYRLSDVIDWENAQMVDMPNSGVSR